MPEDRNEWTRRILDVPRDFYGTVELQFRAGVVRKITRAESFVAPETLEQKTGPMRSRSITRSRCGRTISPEGSRPNFGQLSDQSKFWTGFPARTRRRRLLPVCEIMAHVWEVAHGTTQNRRELCNQTET
jgi:hypothetical protein